ncbi:MAG: sulfonate ABC transporter [Patescibacteria group bacterium]|jgi:hypothetical protein|nr:sulfonate ABC transporter [Patescibacteria group bacterium]
MKAICPECKNEIEIKDPQNISVGTIMECNTCGITLEVSNLDDNGEIKFEVIDEGK